jgi:hypothetical protein
MKINVLIFSMLCLTSVSNAQVSQKKWGYFADVGFGFLPASEGFNGTSSVAAGATYRGQFGLGLASSFLTDDLTGITGLAFMEFKEKVLSFFKNINQYEKDLKSLITIKFEITN